jgi:hypothetical protein
MKNTIKHVRPDLLRYFLEIKRVQNSMGGPHWVCGTPRARMQLDLSLDTCSNVVESFGSRLSSFVDIWMPREEGRHP